MKTCGNIADNIVAVLSANADFGDLCFVVAYENEIKPTPISKPIVAISVKNCEVGERLTETLETGEITATMKRNVKVSVSGDIYLPYSMGGSAGHKIFDRFATFFLFSDNFDISKAICSEADYDNDCDAIILRTQFIFNEIVSA